MGGAKKWIFGCQSELAACADDCWPGDRVAELATIAMKRAQMAWTEMRRRVSKNDTSPSLEVNASVEIRANWKCFGIANSHSLGAEALLILLGLMYGLKARTLQTHHLLRVFPQAVSLRSEARCQLNQCFIVASWCRELHSACRTRDGDDRHPGQTEWRCISQQMGARL